MFTILSSILMNVFFDSAFSCYGGLPNGTDLNISLALNGSQLTGDIPAHYENVFLNGWGGGFEVPESVKEKWRNWLRYEQQKLLLLEKYYDPSKDPDRLHGWPESWKNLGYGLPGVPPPPWAYVPINVGKPAYCHDPLVKGETCDKSQETRWAFNPYTVECISFTYLGCGENQNNFLTQAKCEELCMSEPVSGCDPETMQYFDD